MKKLMFLFLSIFLMLTISNASAAYTMPDKEYLSNSLSGTTTNYKSACGTGNKLLFTGSLTNSDGTTSNTAYITRITNCANAIAKKVINLNGEAFEINKAYYNFELDKYLSSSLNERKQLFITTIESDPILKDSFTGGYENYKLRFISGGIFDNKDQVVAFNLASSGAMTDLKNKINAFTDAKFSLINSGSMTNADKLDTSDSEIDSVLLSKKGDVITRIDNLFNVNNSQFINNNKFSTYYSKIKNIMITNLDKEIEEVKVLVAYKKKAIYFRTQINNNGKIALATELSKLTFNDDSFNNTSNGFKKILKESITGIKRLDTPLLEHKFTPAFFQEVINEATTRKGLISAFLDNFLIVTTPDRGFIIYSSTLQGDLGVIITNLKLTTVPFNPAVKGIRATPIN